MIRKGEGASSTGGVNRRYVEEFSSGNLGVT